MPLLMKYWLLILINLSVNNTEISYKRAKNSKLFQSLLK